MVYPLWSAGRLRKVAAGQIGQIVRHLDSTQHEVHREIRAPVVEAEDLVRLYRERLRGRGPDRVHLDGPVIHGWIWEMLPWLGTAVLDVVVGYRDGRLLRDDTEQEPDVAPSSVALKVFEKRPLERVGIVCASEWQNLCPPIRHAVRIVGQAAAGVSFDVVARVQLDEIGVRPQRRAP